MLFDPHNAKSNDNRLMKKDGRPSHQFAFPSFALKQEPDLTSPTLTEVLFGEGLYMITEGVQWVEVCSMVDGYKGWIPKEALAEGWLQPTHMVSTPLTHIYPKPDMKMSAVTTLSIGSLLTLSKAPATNGYRAIDGGGYVFEKHTRQIGAWGDDPLVTAEKLLYAPYLWGGRTANGIDCSALVQLSLAQIGLECHRDSDLQWQSLGETVDTPQRGDLAFFPGHVGFMVDDKSILHANATNMAVTIDPLDQVINWVRSEGKSEPFLGFKRL